MSEFKMSRLYNKELFLIGMQYKWYRSKCMDMSLNALTTANLNTVELWYFEQWYLEYTGYVKWYSTVDS